MRGPHGIFISQKAYIRKLLKKFNRLECNSSLLLADPKIQLSKHMGMTPTNPKTYRSIVGSLIYLTNTRPDISFAVGSVSRYMENPEIAHLQAAKKILQYLKGTEDHRLFFSTESTNDLHTNIDVDWGRDLDSRRSVSGIVHKLGGSCISWSSKLQPTVSLSSTESEYRVLIDATKDIVYFQRLLDELGLFFEKPTNLYCDNQSCIKLVANPIMHARTKHIEIEHHLFKRFQRLGKYR